MSDALLRHWSLLRLIPRAPQKAEVDQLLQGLRSAGYVISRRQLQRDLIMLSTRFPIEADERTVPFGWSWSRNAPTFDLPRMDGPSALALKLIERHIPQLLPPSISDHLRPWFLRADSALAEHGALPLSRWLDRVRVVPREMPLRAPLVDPDTSRVVYQSLIDARRFTADYNSRTAGSTLRLEVSPLGLVARGNLLYLVATVSDYADVRQLALHRLSRAEPTDRRVIEPAAFDLDRYIAEGEFHYPVGPMISLVAKFARGAAVHLRETALSDDQCITDISSDHVLVTATVSDTEQLRWWLLAFGDLVEVFEPATLRADLRDILRTAAARYEDAPPRTIDS